MFSRFSALTEKLTKAIALCVSRLPTAQLQPLLVQTARYHSRSLAADAGLRFLFEIDAALYPVQGELSIAYGDGTHTKHRHTGYHNFFIDRVSPQDRVLDLGCGYGALAYDVAKSTGATVVGLDLNARSIEQAQQRYSHPQVTYRVGDVLKDMPARRAGAVFDVVILSNVLEHLPQRPQFLRQVQQIIQPQRFLIRVPLFERDWRVPLKRELGVEWRLDATHETEYRVEEFEAEIREAGLVVVHQEIHWSEIWAEVRA
ncbi:MAG: class I SAM-dependent methyltransferase, partial [Cyanobacteria bacterium J06632_22]